MNVRNHMAAPVTVTALAPLSEAKRVMEENGFGVLLVAAEDQTLEGFITRGALKETTDWTVPVGKAAFAARFTVSPDDTLERAALLLVAHRLALLPVVEEGKLVGVVTQAEALAALVRGLGIGLPGTRFTVRLRRDCDDLYRVLDVLHRRNVCLISLAQDRADATHTWVVLRMQGVEDKEGLRSEIETLLRGDG
jgi:acetoin utilization protein AcuB